MMQFGVCYFIKVVDMDAVFQMKLFLINSELYNSRYELRTRKMSRPS